MEPIAPAESETDLMRVPTRLLNKLRVIAAARRETMMDLFERYAGARIDREHQAVIKEQAAIYDLGGEG